MRGGGDDRRLYFSLQDVVVDDLLLSLNWVEVLALGVQVVKNSQNRYFCLV